MAKAIGRTQRSHHAAEAAHHAAMQGIDWGERMTSHIAHALLVYTGLHIFVTMQAIKGESGSILPYFGLVALVAAIIPACRWLEKRWQRRTAASRDDSGLAGAFRRDAAMVWLCALGLPFALTAVLSLI